MAENVAYAIGNGVTVTATEMSLGVTGGTTVGLPISRTDTGMFCLVLDCSAMVKGDEYRLRIYEKAIAASPRLPLVDLRLKHAQPNLRIWPGLHLGAGWDITLQRISATSRAFSWSVRRVN